MLLLFFVVTGTLLRLRCVARLLIVENFNASFFNLLNWLALKRKAEISICYVEKIVTRNAELGLRAFHEMKSMIP